MTFTSIWLTLANEQAAYYQNIINDLAVQHNATPFEPHITLFPFVDWNAEQEARFKEYLQQNCMPFELELQELATSGTFFQCCYLKVAPNARLEKLWSDTRQLLRIEPYDYMPHLSLLYGNYPSATIENLIETKQGKWTQSLKIRQVKVMSCSDDIAAWSAKEVLDLGA